MRIRKAALRSGRNRFTLVVRRGGTILDQVQAPQTAWVR